MCANKWSPTLCENAMFNGSDYTCAVCHNQIDHHAVVCMCVFACFLIYQLRGSRKTDKVLWRGLYYSTYI